MLLSAFQIYTDPLGFSRLTQRYSQDIVNLALIGPFYSKAGQEAVSVVLVEDDTLSTLGMDWPWSYSDQARLLESILPYRPKAVVVDILFVDSRPDATLDQLLTVIRRYEEARVPLYFVGSPVTRIPVRPEVAASGVRLVDSSILFDDGIARQYPSAVTCLNGAAGKENSSGTCPSLALRVYDEVYSPSKTLLSHSDSHLELVWGIGTHPTNRKWMRVVDGDGRPGSCPPEAGVFSRLYVAITDVGRLKSLCPYSGVIPAESLMMGEEDEDIRQLVKDHIVFYGASIEGSADKAYTPTNGLLGGVFVHAMALDNIISFNGKPKRDTVSIGGKLLDSNMAQTIGMGFILMVLTALHIKRIRKLASAEAGSETEEFGFVERLKWYGIALAVIIGTGSLLYIFFQLSLGNWMQMVLLTGLMFELLISPLLGRAWGYLRHTLND